MTAFAKRSSKVMTTLRNALYLSKRAPHRPELPFGRSQLASKSSLSEVITAFWEKFLQLCLKIGQVALLSSLSRRTGVVVRLAGCARTAGFSALTLSLCAAKHERLCLLAFAPLCMASGCGTDSG
jgi:hypothetical protein